MLGTALSAAALWLLVRHVLRAPRVALTFDACSSTTRNRFDERVARAIERERIPATIFLGGEWARAQPKAVKRLAADPRLEFGVHGWGHPRTAALTDARLAADLKRAVAAVGKLTGRPPVLYRPPFGRAVPRDRTVAAKLGLAVVEYDVPSGDPDPRISADALVRWVVGRARDGSIVIFHINGKGRRTAEALPRIVAGLKGRGFRFVTAGDLVRHATAADGTPSGSTAGSKATSASAGSARRAAAGRPARRWSG